MVGTAAINNRKELLVLKGVASVMRRAMVVTRIAVPKVNSGGRRSRMTHFSVLDQISLIL